MEQKRKVVFLILLAILLNLQGIEALVITGQGVTGKASSQTLNVSIQILSSAPTLTILSPENETYLTNVSLLLNYTTSNSQAVWYNIDNSANTTLSSTNGTAYFNTTEGSHVLFLFANNSDGIKNSTNVRFSVNLTLFTINYTEWRGAFKGNSTDFYTSSYEDMQSLSNIILEQNNSGKILFNQAVNLTDDANFSDRNLDLDSNVNTSFNRIELNASALPNFNKQATLWLYGLSFTNPRILLNGVICSASICTQESYSGGILKFNVSSFSGNSIYSSEETPAATTATGGGGGGGGGGISEAKEIDFSIDKDLIRVSVKQGESFKNSVKIKNLADESQHFSLSITNELKEIVFFSPDDFSLSPREERTVTTNFVSFNETKPGVYTGNIEVEGKTEKKKISIVYEIKSKRVLFDLKADVPEKYKEIFIGEDVMLQITLFNLGDLGKQDVALEYQIKDFDGNVIASQSEVVAVETQASFVREIDLPGDIKRGRYVAAALARYDHSIGSSSDVFLVKERQRPLPLAKSFIEKYWWIILIILLLVVIVIIIWQYERWKMKNIISLQQKEIQRAYQKLGSKKADSRDVNELGKTLRQKLKALEEAYSQEYISKDSYLAGRERIEKLYKKLREKSL